MKKIILTARTVFNVRKAGKVTETMTFEKGKVYTVADAVAENAFIKARIASIEDVSVAKPVKAKAPAKKPAPKKEAENASDGN